MLRPFRVSFFKPHRTITEIYRIEGARTRHLHLILMRYKEDLRKAQTVARNKGAVGRKEMAENISQLL